MIDLYYWPTPNGHKITLFLEESGLPYRIVPIDISKGEQFKAEFLAFSPNNRVPAIINQAPADDGEAVGIFESGAEFKTEMDEEARRHMFRHASAR